MSCSETRSTSRHCWGHTPTPHPSPLSPLNHHTAARNSSQTSLNRRNFTSHHYRVLINCVFQFLQHGLRNSSLTSLNSNTDPPTHFIAVCLKRCWVWICVACALHCHPPTLNVVCMTWNILLNWIIWAGVISGHGAIKHTPRNGQNHWCLLYFPHQRRTKN